MAVFKNKSSAAVLKSKTAATRDGWDSQRSGAVLIMKRLKRTSRAETGIVALNITTRVTPTVCH